MYMALLLVFLFFPFTVEFANKDPNGGTHTEIVQWGLVLAAILFTGDIGFWPLAVLLVLVAIVIPLVMLRLIFGKKGGK